MANCSWCGGYFDTHSEGIKVGWGLKMRFYCSNRCKTHGEEAREKSQGSSSKSGGFFSGLFSSGDKADEGPSIADKENDKFDF